MGEPTTYSYNQDEHLIIVFYDGVILRFDNVEIGEDWSGTLSSIRLMGNSTYTIGYNLFAGMTRSQILLAYPFADDTDYELTVGDNRVQFGFDEDDVVSYVKIYSADV